MKNTQTVEAGEQTQMDRSAMWICESCGKTNLVRRNPDRRCEDCGAAQTPKRTQFTPGPWTWSDGYELTHRELHETRFAPGEADSILYHGADWAMSDANARLIAAAPELLAMVKDYAENADCGNGGEHTGKTGDNAEHCWHCSAVALVAKAEGSAK